MTTKYKNVYVKDVATVVGPYENKGPLAKRFDKRSSCEYIDYAETFIIPACVGEYTIRPYGASEGKTCVTIKAYVRC